MISYRNIDNEIITEKCILEDCIKDDLFGLDQSWVRITDALPITGNVTIGNNGNWFVDGEDTGFKAQGPKGDNGQVPYLKLDKGYVWYSYDLVIWHDLIPIIDITPGIEIGEVSTLPAGSKATVSNSSGNKDAILNFGIPMGNTGPQGQKGDTTTIKGRYDTEELLKSAFPNGDGNNSYLVGTVSPYQLYLYLNEEWVSVGTINEVKSGVFDGGRADTKYGGARTIDCGTANTIV